jgi:L-ribulose-5-phosphate 4-epimerase
MLEDLKQEVTRALLALPEAGLVQGTSGNVSGREGHLVVIKPSGVAYEDLVPSGLVVVDMEGNVVEGSLKPSVDTPAHLQIYRTVPELRSVVHTHSTYATVFALLNRELPAYVTELADLFGGPVPVSAYIPPGEETIGTEFAKRTKQGKYRALLMRAHGVFTAGAAVADALRAAEIVEHSAKVALLAELLGEPTALPESEARNLHAKYMERYGQRSPRES